MPNTVKCGEHIAANAWLKRRGFDPYYRFHRKPVSPYGGDVYLILPQKGKAVLWYSANKPPARLEQDKQQKPMARLAAIYSFKNRNKVAEFLEINPHLTDVLIESRKQVVKHFGTQTKSAIEVFTDPDDGDDRKLFVLILTTLPSDEASSRLDQLDQEWWLTQPIEVKRVMNIDVEYVNGSL